MNTLNKICTALSIIFGLSLVVLVAEIVYVLLRGRRFRCRRLASSGGSESSSCGSLNQKQSKQPFYLFCWKNQAARIEPDAGKIEIPATAPPRHSPAVSELDEIMKQHALYGPSRVLFTIREEEREEMEMADSPEKRSRCVSLDEVAVTVSVDPVVIEVYESTPFATPCGSPPFCTPSPSPPREEIPLKTSAGYHRHSPASE